MPRDATKTAGGDLGYRHDPSALCIVSVHDGVIRVVETLEIKPPRGKALQPSAVANAFAARLKHHGIDRITLDLFGVEDARENFAKHDVRLDEAPAGASGKAAVHVAVRTLMREGKVKISVFERRLLQQLKAIVSKPTSGGGLSISTPRRGGAHGDMASAFLLACWSARDLLGNADFSAAEALANMISGCRNPLNAGNPAFDSDWLNRWGDSPGRGFG
jgi:hypothetical protein